MTTTEPELAGKPSGESHRPDLTKLVERARAAAASQAGEIPASVAAISPRSLRATRFFVFTIDGPVEKPISFPDEAEAMEGAEGVPVDAARRQRVGNVGPRDFGFLGLVDQGDAAQAVARHAGRHLADEGQAERDEAAKLIGQFVKSDRANELRRARQLHREIEFLVAWPPDEPVAEWPVSARRDRLPVPGPAWKLARGWTIRPTAPRRRTWRAWRPIMNANADLCLGRGTNPGRWPMSLTLHFLRPGLEHAFVWNETARRQAIELVDRAITAC